MSRDVTLLSSLTLSEAKDNGAQSLENSNGNFPAPQDFRNLDADFGLSNYHQPYNSTTSFVWALPFGAGTALGSASVAGWWTRSSAAGRSPGSTPIYAGEPVTFSLHAGATLRGLGHRAGLPRRQQLPAERDLRSDGARRRADDHQLVQPGLRVGADRSEPAVRQRGAQHRARPEVLAARPGGLASGWRSAARRSSSSGIEAFNLLNRTNFRAPNGNRSAGAFGTITSTYDPRQLQLGFKLLW